jgi:hypothetical protein
VVGIGAGIIIFSLIVSNLTISTFDPPLEAIPSEGIPGLDSQITELGSLVFTVSASGYTSATHSGVNKIRFRVHVSVRNTGNTTISGLKFAKVTIYWENHDAYFTTELENRSSLIDSIVPNDTAYIELQNRRPWSDIPVELCWGSGGGTYGRILAIYNSNQECILTTNLVYLAHMVE